MHISQALKLGFLSIRGYKRRSLTTIIIVSACFGALIGIMLITQGLENTILAIQDRAMNNQYYLQIATNTDNCEINSQFDADGKMQVNVICPKEDLYQEISPFLEGTNSQLVELSQIPKLQGTGEITRISADKYGHSNNPLDLLLSVYETHNFANSAALLESDNSDNDFTQLQNFQIFFLRFDHLSEVQRFYRQANCLSAYDDYCSTNYSNGSEPRRFILTPINTSRIIISMRMDLVKKVLGWLSLAIAVIAGIITLFTFLKILQAEDKTMQLYRSLGASNRDLTYIYASYLIEMCGLIIIASLIIGIIAGLIVSFMNTTGLANMLIGAYGSSLVSQPLILLGWSNLIFIPLGALLFVALLSLLFTLPKLRRQ